MVQVGVQLSLELLTGLFVHRQVVFHDFRLISPEVIEVTVVHDVRVALESHQVECSMDFRVNDSNFVYQTHLERELHSVDL
jgi:hypothetical protein